MNKRILLGIDTNLSPPTQYALHAVSELFEQSSPELYLVLLHVIPIPCDTTPAYGKAIVVPRPFSPTTEERLQAVHVLQQARRILHQKGIAPECIELIRRIGTPADEIVKVATEMHVDCIVIGSRGDSLKQKIRRVIAGSTSRRVLELAPCPIMIAVPPRAPRPRSLVAWYKEAVTQSLNDQSGSLKIFTASDVAQLFAPPNRTVGNKEVDAAVRALEQLAREGVLCCHSVKGEVCYIND